MAKERTAQVAHRQESTGAEGGEKNGFTEKQKHKSVGSLHDQASASCLSKKGGRPFPVPLRQPRKPIFYLEGVKILWEITRFFVTLVCNPPYTSDV